MKESFSEFRKKEININNEIDETLTFFLIFAITQILSAHP